MRVFQYNLHHPSATGVRTLTRNELDVVLNGTLFLSVNVSSWFEREHCTHRLFDMNHGVEQFLGFFNVWKFNKRTECVEHSTKPFDLSRLARLTARMREGVRR